MRTLLAGAVAIATFAPMNAGAALPLVSKSFVDHARGIRFQYPATFEVGQYSTHDYLPSDWSQVVLLVETRLLKGSSALSIPPGEIPDIEIIETTGLRARLQIAEAEAGRGKEYAKVFGQTRGYEFPGGFGPFGDQAFFYLVPTSRDRALMIVAHKYYFNNPSHSVRTPVLSGYDAVVNALLSTLEVAAQ